VIVSTNRPRSAGDSPGQAQRIGGDLSRELASRIAPSSTRALRAGDLPGAPRAQRADRDLRGDRRQELIPRPPGAPPTIMRELRQRIAAGSCVHDKCRIATSGPAGAFTTGPSRTQYNSQFRQKSTTSRGRSSRTTCSIAYADSGTAYGLARVEMTNTEPLPSVTETRTSTSQ
jgi:hypothetical protein